MTAKFVQPSTGLTAFSCPHCSALTTQYWRSIKATFKPDENSAPFRITSLQKEKDFFLKDIQDKEKRRDFELFLERLHSGTPFIEGRHERYTEHVQNADISECYNCKKLAFWIGNELIWPHLNEAPIPNVDMPEEIQRDFLEAGQIARQSPRGSAALLRLCIQKICIHLGEEGKNINSDISSLVKNGLDVRVQKMLDVVRVIGNNAVHPGELDIRDDRKVVEQLFSLVNMIVDSMISQPKAIEKLYTGLGEKIHSAIDRRDMK